MNISTGLTSLIHKWSCSIPLLSWDIHACMQHVCLQSLCSHVAAGSPQPYIQFWFGVTLCRRGHWHTHTHTWTEMCTHAQFWQYNEPTSAAKVTTFILLLWPVHGPSQLHTQLTWLCRQRSKSYSVKLGIFISLLFSVFPPFSLLSSLSSAFISSSLSFPSILFSPFLFCCLCCLR